MKLLAQGSLRVWPVVLAWAALSVAGAWGQTPGSGSSGSAPNTYSGNNTSCMNPPTVTCQKCSSGCDTTTGLTWSHCETQTFEGSTCPPGWTDIQQAHGSPGFVDVSYNQLVLPLPDWGKPTAPGSCTSCGGGGSKPAATTALHLEWGRVFASRLGISEPSFGTAYMFSIYDYRLYRNKYSGNAYSVELTMWDPATQHKASFGKVASTGEWREIGMPAQGLTVLEDSDSFVTIRYPGGNKLRFEMTNYPGGPDAWQNRRGRITYIEDRNGNRVSFNYVQPATDATADVLKWSTIGDSFGRSLAVTYTTFQGGNVISQVTLPDGQTITYQYDPNQSRYFCVGIQYGGGLASTWQHVGAWYSETRVCNEAVLDAHNYKEEFQLYGGRVRYIKRGDGAYRFACSNEYVPASGGAPAKNLSRIWANGVQREIESAYSATSYNIQSNKVRQQRVDGTWEAQQTFETVNPPWYWQPMNKKTLPDGRSVQGTFNNSFFKPTQIQNADGTTESFTYNLLYARPLTHTNEGGRQESWTYDDNGNVLSHTTAIGQPEEASESWTYDAHGQMLTHVDFNGQTTTCTYDAWGYLHTVATPAGDGQPAGTTTYNYDIGGRLTSLTDPVGHTTSYQYDNLSRATQVTYADASTETTTYGTGEFSARVLSTKDRNNNTTFYTYDNTGRVTKVERKDGVTQAVLSTLTRTWYTDVGRVQSEDRDGDVTVYGYDHKGRVILTQVTPKAGVTLSTATEYDRVANFDLDRVKSVTDGYGRKTSYTYNTMDRVLTQSRELTPGGVQLTTSYEYDNERNVTAQVDPRGLRTTYEYDARHRVIAEHFAVGTPEAASVAYTYDANGNRLTKVDENGKTWTYTYTSLNKLRTATDPLGHGSSYEYNADGLTHKVTNANGHDTTYTYANCCGHPTTITNADGTFRTMQYDFKGQVTLMTDEEGNSVGYQYDGLGRKTKVTLDPGGLNLATTYTFNSTSGAIGSIVTVTSPSGQTVTTAYDGLGRTSDVSGDTPHVTYAYDALQQGYVQTTVTDALGQASSSLTDGAGRTVKVTDTLGKNTVMAYDEDGNRVSMTDRDGRVTASVYDARNRLTRTTQDSGGVSAQTNYQYDAVGRLTMLTDAQNHVTQYEYDDAGRQTTATYAFGTAEAKTWSYTYKNLGQVDTITKPDAATVAHTYDARERLITRAYSGIANPDTFTYYANGLSKTAVSGIYGTTVDRSAGIGVSYDTAGRLLSESQDDGSGAKTVAFTYTADSLTDTITYPSGRVLHQTYTTMRQLNAVQLDGAAVVSSHGYDNAGRLTQRNYANGKVANWTYDNKSRMTEVDHVGVQKYDYTYTDEGDPLTQTDVTTAPGSEGYSYDGMHRLATMNRGTQGQPPDFAQAWTLDKVGNWTAFNDNGTNETRTHNALNQLTVRAGNNLVYDANGNQTDDGDKYTFVYDANNRLKEVHDRVTGNPIMTCKYDAMGRRVQRSVLVPAEGQTGGTTRYGYAGQRIVEEYDADNLIQAVYTYGQYIDEPLSMDHVPTSQPASQPAGQPMSQLALSPTPLSLQGGGQDGGTATPTETAIPTVALTLNSPTPSPIQNSPTPSVSSVVETPTPDAVATQVAVMYATPTPSPIPADPVATQIALVYGTPTPAGGGAATLVPTSTPDPLATQIALVYGTPTPSHAGGGEGGGSLTPVPTATALPSATQSALTLTPTPSAIVSATSVPSVVSSPIPSPTQNSEFRIQNLATSQPTLQRYYFHANRLYNVVALTDSTGNVVERYRYDAYGLCTTFDAAYDNPMTFSRLGNPFTYTGRELDTESGLMHYRARTYDPVQGRFEQTDPIGYKGGMNLYEYVQSNPTLYTDPSGLITYNTDEKSCTLNVTLKVNISFTNYKDPYNIFSGAVPASDRWTTASMGKWKDDFKKQNEDYFNKQPYKCFPNKKCCKCANGISVKFTVQMVNFGADYSITVTADSGFRSYVTPILPGYGFSVLSSSDTTVTPYTDPNTGNVYFQNSGIHEVGHMLGLNHPGGDSNDISAYTADSGSLMGLGNTLRVGDFQKAFCTHIKIDPSCNPLTAR